VVRLPSNDNCTELFGIQEVESELVHLAFFIAGDHVASAALPLASNESVIVVSHFLKLPLCSVRLGHVASLIVNAKPRLVRVRREPT
jgi:hypothetical protein